MTEKIIDCFVAGVIPIYLGDPNISQIIPRDIFIDMRDYNSWAEIHFMIKSLTRVTVIILIKSTREFLYSEMGQSLTYQNRAKKIFILLSL